MAEHAIAPFASRQTTSSHYITFQLAAKRLTKTRRQKYSRKFSPPTTFFPVGELGLANVDWPWIYPLSAWISWLLPLAGCELWRLVSRRQITPQS